MRRSDALAPLSRDHHQALNAALRLRRADASRIGGAVDHFSAFWRHGQVHFEIEERLILPALPGDDAEWTAGIERVAREHAAIRRRATELLSAGAEQRVELAHELGELLNDHVRFEERQLFALLEERLSDDELAALGESVAAAEQSAHSEP
jgi:hemerythrin-like domain-containing protein